MRGCLTARNNRLCSRPIMRLSHCFAIGKTACRLRIAAWIFWSTAWICWKRPITWYARARQCRTERLEQHIINQTQELVDLKRLLKDHRALGLKISEPRLTIQRSHDEDWDTVILKLLFNALEGLYPI